MKRLTATKAYFIKLGRAGIWETESLRDGILRFGYKEADYDRCLRGDWRAEWEFWNDFRENAGAATRDVNQIKIFYEADETCLFITFAGGLLYWCRPTGLVERVDDGHRRSTVDGWHSTSMHGTSLTTDRLSGHLLKVQMYRGTICEVKPIDYLLRKLNDELSPEMAAAEEAEEQLMAAIVGLMRLLTWQDFELLVDLVFSTSGWRRVGVVGRAQKTVDLELALPSTGERAFVQVKSQADGAALKDYIARHSSTEAYDRMFFVWHTGSISETDDTEDVTLIGPTKLSRMVLDAGLSSWLREKVS